MDVIWTAEYAAQGWLLDVSDVVAENGDEFIQSTLDTAEYEGKYWAVPFNTNAGFIYYRTAMQVDAPPRDWEDTLRGGRARATASSTRAPATRA